MNSKVLRVSESLAKKCKVCMYIVTNATDQITRKVAKDLFVAFKEKPCFFLGENYFFKAASNELLKDKKSKTLVKEPIHNFLKYI